MVMVQNGCKIWSFLLVFSLFGVFPPVLWLEYWIFISIVDISANLENIDIDIDIDRAILKISISIRLFWKISISIGLFWKISISISILIRRFWKISISIWRFQKISISIKYRIDWNLAYQTGLYPGLSLSPGDGPVESRLLKLPA